MLHLICILILVLAYGATCASAAPESPVRLQAVCLLEKQVSLSWTTSEGASGYRVYRGDRTGGESLLPTLVAGTTFEDAGLASGQTYYYRVTAVAGLAESATSNEAFAETLAPAPTNLAASVAEGRVTLTWRAAATATRYRIYRDTLGGTGGAANFIATGPGFADIGLSSGTTYYYDITPINPAGENFAAAASVAATCPGKRLCPQSRTQKSRREDCLIHRKI